jgi:hypothetical protein
LIDDLDIGTDQRRPGRGGERQGRVARDLDVGGELAVDEDGDVARR